MGPNERELRKVASVAVNDLYTARKAWETSRAALDSVDGRLDEALTALDNQMGIASREAAKDTFTAMKQRVSKHQKELVHGKAALAQAAEAITTVQQVLATWGEITAPTQPPVDATPKEATTYATKQSEYTAACSNRESTAGSMLTTLNAEFDGAIAKLRLARGEEPPQDNTTYGDGTGVSNTGVRSYYTDRPKGVYEVEPKEPKETTNNNNNDDNNDDGGVDSNGGEETETGNPVDETEGPDWTENENGPEYGDPTLTGPGASTGASTGTLSGYTDGVTGSSVSPTGAPNMSPMGGIGGMAATAAGVAGARGAMSALNSLRGVPAVSPGATAGTASAARSAGGMISRSGTAGGAGGRGAGGAAGSRGAGGNMGGRNAAKKKDKRRGKATEHLVDEDEWLDDEGAAPEVLN